MASRIGMWLCCRGILRQLKRDLVILQQNLQKVLNWNLRHQLGLIKTEWALLNEVEDKEDGDVSNVSTSTLKRKTGGGVMLLTISL